MIKTLLGLMSVHGAHAAPAYEWKAVERSASTSGVTVSGRVVPQDGALNIESARVAGRALAILRREGEHVSIGTRLYEISSAECSSLMEEKRVAASKSLEELKTSVAARERQLSLKLENDRCFFTSNHDGILTKRGLESGASFNSGDALATVLDVHHLTVEFDVPERDQPHVRVGQSVKFQFASAPDDNLSGKILNVVPTIDPTTRSSKARVKVDGHLPKDVSLDALIFGEIATGGQMMTFKVPSSALVFYHDKQYVVKGPEATPKSVAVQVLTESDAVSAVRPLDDKTLHEGDLIATTGAIFLLKKLNHEQP